MRLAAIQAIGKLHRAEDRPLLEALQKDPDPTVAVFATDGVDELDSFTKRPTRRLRGRGGGGRRNSWKVLVGAEELFADARVGAASMKTLAAFVLLLGGVVGAAAQDRITIPAVASIVGAAPFFSDVRVFNASNSAPMHVKATYRCFLGACPVSAAVIQFELAPREARALDDMAVNAFGAPNSAGGVEFEEESGGSVADLVVTSRLYSTAPVPTVGMFIPGVGPGAAHRDSVLTQIANGGSGEGFRTNVGAFNPQDTAATVVFAVYWDGHWVGQVQRTIAARSGVQINDIFGSNGINHPELETSDGVVTVQTNGPAVLSYASVIDNHTTDPIFVSGAADVAPVLSVGGLFETDVTLGENTCTPSPRSWTTRRPSRRRPDRTR